MMMIPRQPGETDEAYAARVHALRIFQSQFQGAGVVTPAVPPPGPGRLTINAMTRPQGADEGGLEFGLRNTIGNTLRGAGNFMLWPTRQLAGDVAAAADTPAARTSRAQLRTRRDQRAAAAAPTPTGVPTFAAPGGATPAGPTTYNPFAGFRTTSAPGDPRPGGRRHAGRDWAIPSGTVFRAPMDADILSRRNDPRGYGHYIDVRFADGSEQRFGHLQASRNNTTHVAAGQPLFVTGASGNATGPSIHVETRVGGRPIDPGQYWGTFSPDPQARNRQMEQAAGNFGAPAPAFDSSGWDQAAGYARQAMEAAQQPFNFTAAEAPRPDRPAPTPFAAPDFSAGNAAFEKAQPRNPFDDPRERTRFLRQNYFQGMAQALMSMDWGHGPGVGELLARLGAGALGGRMHGDEQIRERQDRFDQQMQQYQLARASRNDTQAAAVANNANQNIAQMNQHNDSLYSDRISEWTRNMPSVQNGNLITRRRQGDSNNWTTTVTPLGPAARVSYYNQMAQIALGRGQAQNQYNYMVHEAQREDTRTALAYAITNPAASPQQQDQAVVLDLADRIGSVVSSGHWQEMVGNTEAATQLLTQAQASAGYREGYSPTGAPTHDQQERIDEYITSELISRTINGGPQAIRQLYTNPAASAAFLNRRANARRTTRTTTDSRGRQTTSTSQTFGGD